MFKHKSFIFSFIILIILAIGNYLGVKFNLYWFYRWYDIPMHILGGLWVSLFSVFLFNYLRRFFPIYFSRLNISYVVFFVILFITICWEIFEIFGGITFIKDTGYWLDTISDIFNAYIGGAVTYLFFIRKNKNGIELIYENNNQIK